MVKKAKDYYEIMEVSYDISKEDLKRAYYYLAKLYHPDINPRTGNLFKEITEAYNVLKDPIKRREYDLSQGIKSSVICDDLDKAAKYSETTDDDISDRLKNVYAKLKNKNLNEDELFDIIVDQLNIVDDIDDGNNITITTYDNSYSDTKDSNGILQEKKGIIELNNSLQFNSNFSIGIF